MAIADLQKEQDGLGSEVDGKGGGLFLQPFTPHLPCSEDILHSVNSGGLRPLGQGAPHGSSHPGTDQL